MLAGALPIAAHPDQTDRHLPSEPALPALLFGLRLSYRPRPVSRSTQSAASSTIGV